MNSRLMMRCGIVFTLFALVLVPGPTLAQEEDRVWTVEYFANKTLAGGPLCTGEYAYEHLNLQWGLEGPANCAVDPQAFSARFTRRVSFEEDNHYRFLVASDDGARVYVDGQLIFSDWQPRQAYWHYAETYLREGVHEIRVEYYNDSRNAEIQFVWESAYKPPPEASYEIGTTGPTGPESQPSRPSDCPPCDTDGQGGGQAATSGAWIAEYYNNATLYGTPVITRTEPAINYDWGYKSPIPGAINPGYFSARWTQTIDFEPGQWTFTVQTDDGARLYIDDQLVLNAWFPQWQHTYTRTRELSGSHTVRLEYFEQEEVALIKLSWRRVGDPIYSGDSRIEPLDQVVASAPQPPMVNFTADRTAISAGECVTLSWDVQNAHMVYFENEGQPLTGSRTDCPSEGQKTYRLRVVSADGVEQTEAITVSVGAATVAIDLTADRMQVNPNECSTVSWSVTGAAAVYFENQPANPVANQVVCPAATTTYTLRVIKQDGTEETRQVTVQVGTQPTPTPETPDTTITFTANQTQVNLGECVTITWNVQNVQAVYYEGQGVTGTGTRQECPTTSRTYSLRVVRLDGTEEVRTITIAVI